MNTFIKYFKYKRSDNWLNCAYVYQIEDIVNTYAKENNLKILNFSNVEDKGVFVLFEKLS